MHTSFLNRLVRRASCLVGVLGFVAAGPMVPLGIGVLGTPAPSMAQDKAPPGDDVIVFNNGKKITGKILEETPTSVTIKFLSAGIEATMTYPKSELLSVTKGTGQAAPPAATPGKPAPQGDIKALTPAADPNEPGKKKVYVVELTGWFGEDISQTPIRNAVKDAKKYSPDYLVFVMDNDWSLRRFGRMDDIKDDQGQFDQLWRAEDMAPILNDEIPREWPVQPTVVFWVKKAMGGAAFLPLNCRNIYFHSEGKMGGIGGLNRLFTQGDKVVWEKQISLRIGHAEGMAIQGGYESRLIKAMCRDEYVLSYRLEGGRPVYLEREPQSLDETLLTDDADEQAGRADTIELLARGEGNDCLTISSDLAFKLGLSKGTVDTMDDLLFKLGIARNYELVPGFSKRITKGWIDGLEDAKRKLKKLWQDFGDVEVAAPGEYPQRSQARGKRKGICEQMQQLLKQYEEALNPRQVPCPTWAELNIIKERIKTEQIADKPERR